jgi:hypothetical protein
MLDTNVTVNTSRRHNTPQKKKPDNTLGLILFALLLLFCAKMLGFRC